MWSKPIVWVLPSGVTLKYSFKVLGESCDQEVEVGSEQWFKWLELPESDSFNVRISPHLEGLSDFSARREERTTGARYWSAYRRSQGKLKKLYLGKSEELNTDRIQEISKKFLQPNNPGVTYSAVGNSREKTIVVTPSELDVIAAELLKDASLTRNGKDRGSVKRAIVAFCSRLLEGAK